MINKQSMIIFVVLSAFVTTTVCSLYASTSGVKIITPNNFDRLVLQSNEIWIVEFFAPWCGHCRQLVPEYKKAAKALQGVVRVGAVDADEYQELAARFNVRGYPTIKIFGTNKRKPDDYTGQRTSQGFINSALSEIKKKIKYQLKDGASKKKDGTSTRYDESYNSGNSHCGGGSSGNKYSNSKNEDTYDETDDDEQDTKQKMDDNVIQLTDKNFNELVLESEDMWLVEFYAPWCGHCKNLAPHWSRAAKELKGKVKLGALDATKHTKQATKYNIEGYPTIHYFASGDKRNIPQEEYNGNFETSDIVSYALGKFAENIPNPEIVEVLNNDIFINECLQKILCVVTVLPQIYDCQSECRNGYLNVLKEVAANFKSKMWGWVWLEGGVHVELESALDIGGFGYPAMAVISAKKMKYSVLRGSFSKVGIKEFLRDLSYGKSVTVAVRGTTLPSCQNVEPWDGKDKNLPIEDDIDLSDVDLNDKNEF